MAGADFTLDGNSLKALGHNGDPNDTKEKVFNDILHQGFYLNNQRLIEQYINAAPERLKELIDWGIDIRFSEERAIFTSGISIMDALLKQARSVGVELLEDTMLLDLVTEDGRITGGLGLDVKTGEFIRFETKAAVMATGGWHKAFWPNTGMRDLSGEGIAMAGRAGAELGNMEFITFCCNVLYEPPMWRGSIATYVMSLLCGGQTTNSRGEDFLAQYDPYTVKCGTSTEWNKGFVSFASMKEVRAGRGSPSGGVYYGTGDVPWEEFEGPAMMILPNWKYKAMDLTELGRTLKEGGTVEVGPAVEYFDGGIVVDERFETAVQGLYGAGECTLGPFGANRVFSAITEMLVHGADAGRNAAEYASGVQSSGSAAAALDALMEKAGSPLARKDGLRPAEVRRRVQETAHKHLGPIRNKEELQAFVRFLDDVQANDLPNLATTSKVRTYNKEWIDALELENMVQLLEVAAKAALLRTESRGVHYREDCPHTDNDNWLQESIAKRREGVLELTTRPCTFTTVTPPAGVTPYLDIVKKLMEAHSEIGGHH
jgi:succinate dehydrogenase/fumarate reductase flavoprotein subunit